MNVLESKTIQNYQTRPLETGIKIRYFNGPSQCAWSQLMTSADPASGTWYVFKLSDEGKCPIICVSLTL
jgi:hypothetical protein